MRHILVGLLRAGKPIFCPMTRYLPNQQAKFTPPLHRLQQSPTSTAAAALAGPIKTSRGPMALLLPPLTGR